MAVRLAARSFGEALSFSTPTIFLHGLLGSSINFRALCNNRDVMGNRPVHSLDLRNHGASPHTASMLWSEMAEDVVNFLDVEGYETARVVGHSLGGKVAMALALLHPHRVENLVVVDIAPVHYAASPHNRGVDKLIEAMQDLDLTHVRSRMQADEMAREAVPNDFVRGFVMQNLVPDKARGAGMVWRCNLHTLQRSLPYLRAFDCADGSAEAHLPTLFVRGEKSDHVHPRHYAETQRMFPNSEIAVVQGAGHYLHAEKPKEFGDLLARFWNE